MNPSSLEIKKSIIACIFNLLAACCILGIEALNMRWCMWQANPEQEIMIPSGTVKVSEKVLEGSALSFEC